MDNRLTKKRLSDYLAYEWILIIFVCVLAIVLWELIFTVSSVRLTVGQEYKIYYDRNVVYSDNYRALLNQLGVQDQLGIENGKTFSFDVQKISGEGILKENDVLSLRLTVHEGDLLVTDDYVGEESGASALAKSRVDSAEIPITTYDKLLSDAKAYLSGLLVDGQTDIKAENLDPVKIKAGFDKRLSKDNRFRTQAQKEKGLVLETERLQKLCAEVSAFEKVLEKDDLFFKYTRFEQCLELERAKGEQADQQLIDEYIKYIDIEKTSGRESARYGLRIDAFKNYKAEGKTDVTTFFSRYDAKENATADNIMLMVFDFTSYQPELQFESIVVINNVVRACTNILD